MAARVGLAQNDGILSANGLSPRMSRFNLGAKE